MCHQIQPSSVKKNQQTEGETRKLLLIIDNSPTHPPLDQLRSKDKDFKVQLLPPTVTVLLQPIDQGITEKVKQTNRKQALNHLLIDEWDTEIIAASAKKLNMKDWTYMLVDAWEILTKAILMCKMDRKCYGLLKKST